MSIVRPTLCAAAFAVIALGLPPAMAANDFDQKPETYICPNGGDAIDCYLEAVPHLYTMCRQIKSIEILEFGYEHSEDGVNGAKTEYCVDKHKRTITRHFQAALRAATKSRAAVESLRALQDLWSKSLAELRWHPGESDEQYKARVATPYKEFEVRAEEVRADLASAKAPAKARHAAAPAKAAVAAKP